MNLLAACFKHFVKNTSANMAMILAVAAPAIFGSGALATDYAMLFKKRAELQSIADSAALAAAKEKPIAKGDAAYFQAVAQAYIDANYDNVNAKSGERIAVQTTLLDKPFGFKVEIKEYWTPFFAHILQSGVTPVQASAVAQMAGAGTVCVVGLLDYKTHSSIHLDQNSKLLAPGCGIYSNSPSKSGFRADNNATISAYSICSVGGYYSLKGKPVMDPKPLSDCAKIQDPLGNRAAPVSGSYNHTDLLVTDDTTLNPGTYCGGLKITGTARVFLNPGIYEMKDGPLLVEDEAELEGKSVGFYLTGGNSLFNFRKDSRIDLEAPTSGPLAGILVYEDRKAPYSFKKFDPMKPWLTLDANGYNVPDDNIRIHVISSNNARNLIGTFYLPNSIFLINSTDKVADKSAYTAIITARLWLQEGPTLVLNSDYTSTQVPVPPGLVQEHLVLTR